MNTLLAALIPIAIVALGFEVFCLVDLMRAEQVRFVPRWVWAVICIVSIPLGGVAYLLLGKVR